jgi:hypothetical protein
LFHARGLFGLNGAEPDFLIIGAQKSGTSSLFRYIAQSPHFCRPASKEVHYFDRSYDKPFDYYRKMFPKTAGLDFTGEASPSYLFYDFVPERVAVHMPGIRIVATLRNPIGRALSHFHHNKRRGKFLNVHGQDITTFEEHVEHNLRMEITPQTSPFDLKNFHIIERGFYKDQIENWLRHFPRDQYHFIDFDVLTADPQAEVDRLMRFLGRPEYALASSQKFNSGGSYSRAIAPETLARLTELYKDRNEGLSELVGFPTDYWFAKPD